MDGRRVPVLGLDVGSTNVKAVLVDLDVGAAAHARAVTPVAVRSAPTPDRAEALVAVVLGLVRAVLEGRPAPEAVGIASMAETGVPLGTDGEPLTGLLRWDGRRGDDDAARVAADLGAPALFRATGVRASAKVPLVTWHWLRRTEPALWGRVARWAGAADLVAHALTGRLVTDHTLAGRTMAYQLPPTGDPLPRAFDADLLATVGWTTDRLPDVALPGDAPPVVTDPRFVAAGLRGGTPVLVAGHDHAVGTWAAGARDPGDRADSVGTAEAVLTVLGRPVDRARVARQGMSLVRTVAGVHEAVLAGSPAAGAMARWWSDTVLAGRALADVLPHEPPVEPTGMVVLPYPHGRQSPWPDPSARVRVLDELDRDVTVEALAAAAGDASLVRRHTVAMLEGLALQARWMLDVQAELGGGRGRHGAGAPGQDGPARSADATGPVLVLAGAAASNAVWMGLKAAVAAGPVHLVLAAEPVATGAALLAAERVGLVPAGVLRLPAHAVDRPGPGGGTWAGSPPAGRPGRAGALARFVAAATHPPTSPPPPAADGGAPTGRAGGDR